MTLIVARLNLGGDLDGELGGELDGDQGGDCSPFPLSCTGAGSPF